MHLRVMEKYETDNECGSETIIIFAHLELSSTQHKITSDPSTITWFSTNQQLLIDSVANKSQPEIWRNMSLKIEICHIKSGFRATNISVHFPSNNVHRMEFCSLRT